MDYLYILYIFLSVVITIGGTFALVKSDREIAAVIFIIGVLLVLVYYGLRWFSGESLKVKNDSGTWPPQMNLCPDLLTLTTRTVGSTKSRVCIDMIGIARQGGTGIKKFTEASDINNLDFIFNLHQDKSGAARLAALCQECRTKQVTWEGVYDGIGCVTPSSRANPNGVPEEKKC